MLQRLLTAARRLWARLTRRTALDEYTLREPRTGCWVHGTAKGFVLRPTKFGAAIFSKAAAASLAASMRTKGIELEAVPLTDFIKMPGYANRSQRRNLRVVK